jgi:DNA polymerase I-like protein with 3'-5' exonuclease and polymerase domains
MRILCVDSETKGLDLRDEVKTIQVWEGKKGREYKLPEQKKQFLRECKKDFEDPKVIKVIHSSEFDIPMIFWWTDVFIENVWDSKLMESVILGLGMQKTRSTEKDPKWSTNLDLTLRRRGIAKLNKELRALHYDKIEQQRYEEVYGKKEVERMKSKYGMDDVKYLTELYLQQEEDIRELQLENVAWLENNCAEVTAIMRINGIGFNQRTWEEVADDTQAKYDELWNKLPAHVSWTSPAQVKKFFGKRGIRIKSYKDFWTMTGDIKKSWLGLDEHLDNFLHMQKMYKAITSYGHGWLTNKYNYPTVFDDNRVRANFSQIVDTGRYSMDNPNLQQLPAKLRHRNAFQAAPGWTFCISDYTGQELGIIAIGAGEQVWIDAMLKGHDVHNVMGRILHGQKNWNKWAEPGCTFPKKCKCKKHNEVRRPVKDLNFGLAYGKGAAALAEDMGVTQEEAVKLIKAYKKVTPAINKWLAKNGYHGIKHKEAFTLEPFARRRTLLEPEEWRRRNQGKNTPVQGTGGDIIKLALVRMWKYIRKHELQDKVKIVLCVHDEIITEVREDFAKEWMPIMKRIMNRAAEYVLEQPVVVTEPFVNWFWPSKKQIDEFGTARIADAMPFRKKIQSDLKQAA